MTRKFLIKALEPQPFVGIRAVTTIDELSDTLNDLLTDVWAHLNTQPHVTVGPAIVRYHGHSGDAPGPPAIDVEAGFPVAEAVPDGSRARRVTLPGGRAATTLHWGPYAGLPESWDALEAWMKAEGFAPAGPRWEIYWVDPSQAQDDSELRTELVWPLADGHAAIDPAH